jgi:glycosyltransferase involved in cell wall biosynthesis
VNDGSTDDTKEYLNNLAIKKDLLKIINREKSGGVNTARNQGLKINQSEWIAWLDDDDEFLPEAIFLFEQKIKEVPDNISVIYFNTITNTGKSSFVGGFQFVEGQNFYEPSFTDVMTKFNLKGDCKAIFRAKLFQSGKYLFPETVNGFESYTIAKMAKDKVGIRYCREVSTVMNLQPDFEHLSFSASKKNPWPLFLLHTSQFIDYFDFYLSHPRILQSKIVAMAKLFIRSLLSLLNSAN